MFLTMEEVVATVVKATQRNALETDRMMADFMPQGVFARLVQTFNTTRNRNPQRSGDSAMDETICFLMGFDAGWDLAMRAMKGDRDET
ncbi:MAG TPA: hypothetical protein VJQ25_02230 [Nitrospira sp.]|nr:hypothetical protein [Nitrospira sp.]